MSKHGIKKVVLAYSGGLDTSIILKWLQTEYGAEVVTFTADLGQGEEIEPARAKALAAGVKPENIFIEDVREEFVRDYVFPMFRANTVYEGQYLLGTSIARPLIAKKQIEIARQTGADAVSHGATGKGNDQVRFELGYYALEPDIRVIAPWREWDFKSREALLDFAERHQIQIAKDKRGEAPFSVMKSRGVYETPGGTILLAAHRGIESITLDRGSAHLKDELMPRYASLIYNGFWFSPEREMLQAAIDLSQKHVTGQVRVKLYKGNVSVIGRTSPWSLYDQDLVTFEEGRVAYDHRDAAGFIKLNALRLRVQARRDRRTRG
ncbi:MAG: argininosuccinate synthase [Phenylobacterium sp.]|nr:argininosuccinate synthase [Phenylobacterium sp.]